MLDKVKSNYDILLKSKSINNINKPSNINGYDSNGNKSALLKQQNEGISSPIGKVNFLREIFSSNSVSLNRNHNREVVESNKTKIIRDGGYVLEVDEKGKIVKILEEPIWIRQNKKSFNNDSNKNKEKKKKDKIYKIKGIKYNSKSSIKLVSAVAARVKIIDTIKTKCEITKDKNHRLINVKEVVDKFTDVVVYHNKKMKSLDKKLFTAHKLKNSLKRRKIDFNKIGLKIGENNNLLLDKDYFVDKLSSDFEEVRQIMSKEDGILDYLNGLIDSCWDVNNSSYGMGGIYTGGMEIGGLLDTLD